MTGAGSSSVAWTPESSYLGGPSGTPTYYVPGTNIQIQNVELTRNLLAIYAPGDVEAQDFLAQNLEGALGLSWLIKNDDYHRLLFNDSFTGFTSGLANSAEWYLGVDYVGGTTERQIKGWAPATCQVQYNGSTETIRVTMTGAYGDEEQNTSITPGSLSNAGDEVPGFGSTWKVAGSAIGDRLQSAQLSFEQISRLQTGNSQKPIEAVQGNVQESIDLTAIYQGPTQYERALGGAGATSVQQSVDSVTGAVEFVAGGSTVADYSFSTIKPNSYNWEDLVNNEVDLNEAITFNATGVTGSDPTV